MNMSLKMTYDAEPFHTLLVQRWFRTRSYVHLNLIQTYILNPLSDNLDLVVGGTMDINVVILTTYIVNVTTYGSQMIFGA